MKTKKKIFSIFAILFALIFAIALVFGAACSKDDDDTKDNEPEITEPEDDGSGDGSGSGSGDDSGSGNTDTQDEGTGSGDGSGDGSGSGSGDGTGSGSGSGTVTIPEGTENVYTLSVDFSDPDTYAWIGTPDTEDTDDNGSFMWLTIIAGTYTKDLLTYKGTWTSSGNAATINKENAGALYTKNNSGDYFAIDLAGLDVEYVTVNAEMCSNVDADKAENRSLVLNTTASTADGLAEATSASKEDPQELSYVGEVTEDETLYLKWTNNIQIFSIEINLYGGTAPDFSGDGNEGGDDTGNTEPATATGVTLSADTITRHVEGTYTITATVTSDKDVTDDEGNTTYAYVWTGTEAWESSNSEIATVTPSTNGTATIKGVATGSATITLAVSETVSATCSVTVNTAPTAPEATGENGISLDFSSAANNTWVETYTSGSTTSIDNKMTYTYGIVSLTTRNSGNGMAFSNDALTTQGKTDVSNGTATGGYFTIDLSAYEGKAVTISSEMSNTGNNSVRYLMLTTDSATIKMPDEGTTDETILANQSATSTTKATLTYTAEITNANSTLYLTWDASIRIYSLNISVTTA